MGEIFRERLSIAALSTRVERMMAALEAAAADEA